MTGPVSTKGRSRKEGAAELMRLALMMQGRLNGVTLQDIEQEFGVNRRTAQRMIASLEILFPSAMEAWVETVDERKKHWRLEKGTINGLVRFELDELAALSAGIELLEKDSRPEEAGHLKALQDKVMAITANRTTVDPDLETLIEAEGLVARPGPRPKVFAQVKQELYAAIKARRWVRLTYRRNEEGAPFEDEVDPYGFLYGHRHYLVAWKDRPGETLPSLYSLSRIVQAEMLTTPSNRPATFSMAQFANRSFGVFQEKVLHDVVWRFRPEAAARAEEFLFHPDQKTKREKDGSLTVRFKAGGFLEMAWHLLMWGDQVEVIKPKKVRDLVTGLQASWPGLP